MDKYGLKIFRDDGALFISPEVTPMNYVGKFRATGNTSIMTNVDDTADIMPFIRNDNISGSTHLTWSKVSGKWRLNVTTNGGVWIYLFATIVTVKQGVGLAVYNADGVMTWNTDCLPLQVHTVPNPWNGTPLTDKSKIDVNVGVPAAIMPGICSNYLIIVEPRVPTYIYGSMVARAYGNVVGAYTWGGKMIKARPPSPRLRKDYVYIDTSLYP